jgi:hydroxypyruvate reductase
MKIQISDSPLTIIQQDKLLRIITAGLEAADPRKAVRTAISVRKGSLVINETQRIIAKQRNIHLIGAGKASIPMAQGLADILGDAIAGGVLITKTFPSEMNFHFPGRIEIFKGNHPIPGEDSIRSTKKLVEYCRSIPKNDLVICLISGGGSSLMALPFGGIKLVEIQALTKELLKCGATIGEINTIRKHLDRVKGGGLTRFCSPAEVLTLAISDVIANPPETIASGPTVPDASTYQDAMRIIQKYHLLESLPASILRIFEDGIEGRKPETLKSGDEVFENSTFQIIASNEKSVSASLDEASRMGFDTINLGSSIEGEASRVGKQLADTLLKNKVNNFGNTKPICMVGGGETTVRLKGGGYGGRNLEVALGAVQSLAGRKDICLVALASDGEDGPTDAAGAVITGDTSRKGEIRGLDLLQYLSDNDSYHFIKQAGGMIRSGSTGTNVMDLYFLIIF